MEKNNFVNFENSDEFRLKAKTVQALMESVAEAINGHHINIGIVALCTVLKSLAQSIFEECKDDEQMKEEIGSIFDELLMSVLFYRRMLWQMPDLNKKLESLSEECLAKIKAASHAKD